MEVQRDLLLAVSVQDDYYDDVLFKASTSGGVITDARWKCTDRHYQGWYLPEFNDSGWNAAYVHKENYPIDALPLEAQWIGNPAYPADQIYCRRAVSLGGYRAIPVIRLKSWAPCNWLCFCCVPAIIFIVCHFCVAYTRVCRHIRARSDLFLRTRRSSACQVVS